VDQLDRPRERRRRRIPPSPRRPSSASHHPKWHERPLLIVNRKPDAQIDKQELVEFLATKVAKWWLPDDVQFVEAIPHTATGKILKTRLREDFKDYKLPTA
jgi:acyl-CoA synthetase (AMP-forming)/AMP-acid ligase II